MQAVRPSCCKYCKTERMPHRHGKFERWLYTLSERILLPVFRFLCPDCKRTMSVTPDVVEAHHQTSVEVKEEVIRSAKEGQSIPAIAIRSQGFAGGPYSEKTLRRWIRSWRQRFMRHQDRLWAMLLYDGMDSELPRERDSDLRALLTAWTGGQDGKSLFSTLLRLDCSIALTVRDVHPTEAGHSRGNRLLRQ
jgi:transposase-like protein